jgi:restriction system protein
MTTIQVRSRHLASIRVGTIQAKYSVDRTRILRYFMDFWHNELHLHKDLSAPELYLLQGKVDSLMSAWDKKFDDHLRKSKLTAGKEAADEMTIEASEKISGLNRILEHTLKIDDRIDWSSLKDTAAFQLSQFPDKRPSRKRAAPPEYSEPRISFIDIILGKKSKKLAAAATTFEESKIEWEKRERLFQTTYNAELARWQERKRNFESNQETEQTNFLKTQAENNQKIDALADGVRHGDPRSVVEHVTLVLERSDYHDLFEKSFEIDYVPQDKTLLIEYELPSPDILPTLKQARFISSTGEIRETHISDREKKANFDSACYQICLRTLHEIFESDEHDNVRKVLFNGFATYVDRSTGKDTSSCIMSVLTDKIEFTSIDLARVDPKACFKSMKGVSASSLSALAPIPPVMEINKQDRRFIEGRDTIHKIDDATNLASMDWSDFEHLVRELFEKEFASRGGEVRVTQSSSDGGVDAVAFDPDPITGGKIVIQAKRYTRTVGVSAVRDLYGTMQHEGASRGILITTADYGPDAHQFSSGKPITLFTGANLLHLLSKHGYVAKIDLQEARKELNMARQ